MGEDVGSTPEAQLSVAGLCKSKGCFQPDLNGSPDLRSACGRTRREKAAMVTLRISRGEEQQKL